MRPVRLEMKGFGPFRDRTVVDFGDAELLAFVGPTGSGKSTIIDAITFALYGSVARYEDNRVVAPVISSLEQEARVQLDFLVGDEQWSAARVVRRTKNGASTREARLEHDGQVLSGSAKELSDAVRELIGLDVDQFNKTVVLPQGDFAQFLRQSSGDRHELLRRLFDLEAYARMGALARARAGEAKRQAEIRRDLLAGEDEITPERIGELEERVGELRAVRTAVAADVAELARLDHEQEELMGRRRGAAATIEQLVALARPTGVDDLADELAGADEQLVRAEDRLAAGRVALTAAREAASSGPDGGQARHLLGRHDALDHGRAALADATSEHDVAEEQARTARDASQQIRDELATEAAAVDAARAQRDEAQSALDDGPDKGRIDALLKAHTDRGQQAARLAEVELSAAAAASTLDEAIRLAAEARHAHDEARQHEDEATAAAGAAGLVAALHVGEPCPVCRQVVAEIPDHDLDAELAAARAATAERKRSLDEAEGELRRAEGEQSTARANAIAIQARIDELDRELAGAPGPDQLADERARSDALAARLQAAAQTLRDAERREQAVRTDPDRQAVLAAADAAALKVANAAGAVTTLAARVDDLDRELADAPDRARLERDRAEADRLAGAVRDAEQEMTDTEAAEATARARRRDAADAVKAARRDLGRARDALAALGPPPLDDVSLAAGWDALLAWAASTSTALAAEMDGLDRSAAERRTQIDELTTSIDARARPWLTRPSTDPLPEQLARAEESARHDHTRAVESMAQQQESRAAIALLVAEAEVAGELGRLLSTRGFESWLLEEAVADLVERATERLLELSGGQYSLVADETEFKVRDHRNADEIREARTLSGGETFLTSLALALALAESVAELATSGSPRLDSIFLDEGFGTLDPDTLDAVAAAIEELGASGRMVGIVTHIRDLAERMPVRIEVAKGSTSSSVQRVEV